MIKFLSMTLPQLAANLNIYIFNDTSNICSDYYNNFNASLCFYCLILTVAYSFKILICCMKESNNFRFF